MCNLQINQILRKTTVIEELRDYHKMGCKGQEKKKKKKNACPMQIMLYAILSCLYRKSMFENNFIMSMSDKRSGNKKYA